VTKWKDWIGDDWQLATLDTEENSHKKGTISAFFSCLLAAFPGAGSLFPFYFLIINNKDWDEITEPLLFLIGRL